MRRLYGVTDERTQMAKIRYLHMKDDTQRLICRTLHEHNGMVMQKLKEDGSKKRMFNHIKRLMRKQEQKVTSIKILNSSGITVNDEQEVVKEVVKEVERFWGNLFCTNGKVTLGQKKEMIGNGMTSEGQIFSQQEMSVAIKKMKENKAADESGVIAEYLKALEVEEGSKRHSLQVVELSQQTRTAVQIVSNPHAPSNGGPIYRFLGMRTRWMAGAAAHKSG